MSSAKISSTNLLSKILVIVNNALNENENYQSLSLANITYAEMTTVFLGMRNFISNIRIVMIIVLPKIDLKVKF